MLSLFDYCRKVVVDKFGLFLSTGLRKTRPPSPGSLTLTGGGMGEVNDVGGTGGGAEVFGITVGVEDVGFGKKFC